MDKVVKVDVRSDPGCLGSGARRRQPSILRKVYHRSRWLALSVGTAGRAGRTSVLSPQVVNVGQLPASQFPRTARRYVQAGNWDEQTVPIEEHAVYTSMVEHFKNGVAWEDTARHRQAVAQIECGKSFRGVVSLAEIDTLFARWDQLYHNIRDNGFCSNRELYKQGAIDNPCKRLDEVTLNLSRIGAPILNDGWHRFCIARILKLSFIPVRILARHESYPSWSPAPFLQSENSHENH